MNFSKVPHLITIVIAMLFTVACSTESVSEDEGLFENETASKLVIKLSAQEEALFNMVNDHRILNGLSTLEFSPESYEFALEHNEYMISKGEISHDNFSDRASKISKATSRCFAELGLG